MSWKVKVIAGVLVCFVCPLIVYLSFVGRTQTHPVEQVNAKTKNNKEDNSSSEAIHATTSDKKPETSSEPIRNVSPTLELDKMMEFFEQDVFEDAQREANIAAMQK